MTASVPSQRPSLADTGARVASGVARRIASIDIVRGAVMVLMAIDHVRVYSGLPPGGPTVGIFFTRWITHFCAPAFVFLAGTSAFLSARKRAPGELSRYLLTRGVLLVALELTVLRLAWTFNFDYAHYVLAGVIWMIGWCMILMAGLTRLPMGALATIGLVIVAGHNLIDPFAAKIGPALRASSLAPLLQLLYFGGPIQLGSNGPTLVVLYSIIPWIGVMAAGYAFGTIMVKEESQRRRLCLAIGLGSIALFLVLRGFNLYGDPSPWGVGDGPNGPQPLTGRAAFLSFLATNKYPASLSFLLMTLGPTIALIPLLEHARGAVARVLTVFGRVPFFFYLLHIPLIHGLALIVSKIRLGEVSSWLFLNHPSGRPPAPDGYTWSLSLLYLVWAIAVALLYLPCRRYAELKERGGKRWLSYL